MGTRRITPAGAGKTKCGHGFGMRFKDHPRRCGENCRLQPLMRHSVKDHPRRCGENNRRRWRLHRALGSPPQVRGKPAAKAFGYVRTGITPAGAGKTSCDVPTTCNRLDHPRRCGENQKTPVLSIGTPGSPPQVRGKRAGRLPGNALRRITPAGAGKTCAGRYSTYHSQDHPRRCGENQAGKKSPFFCRGSPPQVRGKPDTKARRAVVSRITPAGAGKTTVDSFTSNKPRDHPRRCGENSRTSCGCRYP